MSEPTLLTVSDILNIAVWSGAAGGLIAVGTQITIKQKEIMFAKEPVHLWSFLVIVFTHIVMGMGSAVGLLFLFHFLQLLHADQTVDNVVFLISGCLIAGIGAQRLIPALTNSMTEKLNLIEKEAEETKEIVEETALLAKSAATLDPAASITERMKAIDNIKAQLSRTPLDRSLNILLGRLYRRVGDYSGAVGCLELFVKRKEDAGQIDRDLADALYNIACYNSLEWGAKKSQEAKRRALENLRRSAVILPENRNDAKNDADFADLRQDPEFLEIVG